MEKKKYNPINPNDLTKEEQNAYFNNLEEIQYLEDRVPNIYRGSEKLWEFLESGQLGIGIVIRVEISDWGKDPHYMITPEGLVDIAHGGVKTLTPEEALDVFDKPFWEINGLGIL